MLLQKPIESGDIIAIKLSTGEELIAKLNSVGNDNIVISKPLTVTLAQDPRTGSVGIQMLPYFVLCGDADAKLTIKDSHIVTRTLANENAKSGYIQNTTGLTVASSGLIR